MWSPVFERSVDASGEVRFRVGHDLVDEFLASLRPRTTTLSRRKAFRIVPAIHPERCADGRGRGAVGVHGAGLGDVGI